MSLQIVSCPEDNHQATKLRVYIIKYQNKQSDPLKNSGKFGIHFRGNM